MIDYTPLYFLIFGILSISLLDASIKDWKTRTIKVKTWWLPVYVALPLSFIPLINQIWDGTINITNPIHAFGMIYPLFIIGLIFIISVNSTKFTMGGADVIAISIILITSIPMGLLLGISYMAILIILNIISVIITFYLKKRGDFKIPLIVPISFAYFITVPLYFTFGNSFWSWAFILV